MRLATLRRAGGTVAARIDDDVAVVVPHAKDVGELLADPFWRERAESVSTTSADVLTLADLGPSVWAPVVPRPSKIVCVGLNYREHILEMGRPLPAYPTLFAKFAEALIGANDDILVPVGAASAVDWEGELAVVIGQRVKETTPAGALDAIAGFSVLNDVTMRDWQYRTTQWLQGKTFEATCPFGPVLVTTDEYVSGAQLSTWVNSSRQQHASTADLVFGPAELVAYISSIVTLQPGDVIATGTPGGVGHALPVPRHLAIGDLLETSIEGIGKLINRVSLRP